MSLYRNKIYRKGLRKRITRMFTIHTSFIDKVGNNRNLEVGQTMECVRTDSNNRYQFSPYDLECNTFQLRGNIFYDVVSLRYLAVLNMHERVSLFGKCNAIVGGSKECLSMS